MNKSSPFFSFSACLALIVALTIYRIWVLFHSSFDLYPDEAQYWFWSLHPDWGYYSKPPMVAWLITATTSLCGSTEFCVRLSAPILHTLTALCIYGITQSLFRDRLTAWCSSLTYLTLPAVSLSSLIISTDVPFLFFWALSMLGLVKALESEHWYWWILAGIAAGFGLLSKYTMIVFLPSAILGMWLVPHYRKHLSSKYFYLAILITALVYFPNLIWNYQNGFVSYLHTKDNADLQHSLFHPLQMLAFIGSQFGVFGPILFGTLLVIVYRLVTRSSHSQKPLDSANVNLLTSLTLPFLVLITGISLLSRAHANWAAPTYIAATILVTAWLVYGKHYRLVITSLLLHCAVMFISYHFDGIKHIAHIPDKKATDPFRNLHGWEKLGEAVAAVKQQYPNATLLTNDRKIITSLLYYIHPMPEVIKWNADGHIQDHFELTTTMQGQEGKNFLLVVKKDQTGDILTYFKEHQNIMTLSIAIYPDYIQNYDVYLLTAFKGY